MTRILTRVEYEELRQESLQKGKIAYHFDGFDCVETYQHYFSRGHNRAVQLRPGLDLYLIDHERLKPVSLENQHPESIPLISKFYLSGNHGVSNPASIKGVKDDYVESSSQNYLLFLPDIKEIEHRPAGQRLCVVTIHTSLDFVRSFSTDFDSLPLGLQPLLENDAVQRFHYPVGMNTAAMQVALQQILNCPFQGMMKRIYLESKVLELMALQFTQLVKSNTGCSSSSSFRANDIDRIHQAKDLLICNLDNPPSLSTLARQVGLSEGKLKQGFRQVFGTTAFGYLHDHRMGQAQLLLAEREITVTEAAYAVGYTNLSAFSTAFHKKFRVSPKAYQMGK